MTDDKPKDDQRVQQPATPAPEAPAKKGVKILLVEDDPVLAKMYQAKFSAEGFEMVIAEDGEKGLDATTKDNFNLIILDIMMPQMSGLDLLEKLRATASGKDVPVIVLTNLTEQEEQKRAQSLGVKEYLVKASLTPSEIVERIKKHL